MLDKFNKWWSNNGQLAGFVFMIIYLNGYFICFAKKFHEDKFYPASWLIQFVMLLIWYKWQSKKHGWRLPKDIKDTH